MSKKYLINESTLTAIATAIRRKIFSTNSLDPEMFATLIESIQGGEAGAVISADDGLLEVLLDGTYDGNKVELANLPTSQRGWFGTVVPNEGLISKVYINTQLSVEEMLDIFQEISFIEDPSGTGGLLSACITDIEMENSVYVYFNTVVNKYFINYRTNGADTLIWSQDNGWTSGFTGEIIFNDTNDLAILLNSYGLDLDHNSKWTSLFSITPLVKDSIGVIDLQNYINEHKIPLSFTIPVWNSEFEGGAEVYTWTRPMQSKEELIIEQVFEATLQDSILEVK